MKHISLPPQNFAFSSFVRSLRPACLAAVCLLAAPAGFAALIDTWRAEDLNLNDGDAVGTWSSASNRVANAAVGEQPLLRLNATPGGTKAVRFNGAQRLTEIGRASCRERV